MRPLLSGQAEGASHPASRLRGHAEGQVGLAGNDDALNELSVGEPEENFLGPVRGRLDPGDLKAADRCNLAQHFPDVLGQVRHFIDGFDALLVEPFEDLGGPVLLLPQTGDQGLQIGEREVFQVDLTRFFF